MPLHPVDAPGAVAPFALAQGIGAIPHRRWKNHPRHGTDFPDMGVASTDPQMFRRIVDAFAALIPEDTDAVAGIDMGGFGLAGAIALRKGIGCIDIRKVDALRPTVIRTMVENYEIGEGVCISKGWLRPGLSFVVIDDGLMSGGTALAAVKLIRRLGITCRRALFVFELEGMGGREKLAGEDLEVFALNTVPEKL